MTVAQIRRLLGLPVFESLIVLILASVAIRLSSFKTIAGRLRSRAQAGPEATNESAARIRESLDAWGRRLPWRALCFEKGLAAHWMLRRRRCASTLFYGAATIAGELKAHVWVRSGPVDVMGCENAADYSLLAQFPPSSRVSDGSPAKR